MPEKVKPPFKKRIKRFFSRPENDIILLAILFSAGLVAYNYFSSPVIELTGVSVAYQNTVVVSNKIETTIPREAMINVNKASADELMVLPGMTRKIADAVIKRRGELGYYITVDQLLDVTGMTKTLYNKISPYIKLVDAS